MNGSRLVHVSGDEVVKPGLDSRSNIWRRDGLRGQETLDSPDVLGAFIFAIDVPGKFISIMTLKCVTRLCLTRTGGL